MVRTRIQLDDELFCWDVVPSWEHSFGIQFGPNDFAQAVTVGQVWAVVEQRLVAKFGDVPPGLTAACATQRAFYRLRRVLVAQGVARAAVTPNHALAPWFPWWGRPQRWREWQRESQLPLPTLRTSAAVFVLLWASSGVAAGLVLPNWWMAIATGLCTALAADTHGLTRWALPVDTVGELAKHLVVTEYRALTHPAMRHNRSEWRDIILAGLARCGSEEIDIDPNELYDGTALAW
jgi:hypothetical protein